jgi:vitamin B12 transporter
MQRRIGVAAALLAAATALCVRRSAAQEPTEIVVRGESKAERLRDSALAVQVLETAEAKKQSADLGELLARASGISIRREGGLGSNLRLSLNGATDDQVRVFLDGVPLELAGYPFGVANVPVNLVDRVEVYRGVVPIRFGADALGGAINLVGDESIDGTHAAASFQAGSFGTQRLTLGVRTQDEPSGFFTRASAFHDRADNDYAIDVEWPNELGRPEPLRVRRFHDAYRAAGANVEAGFVNHSWARRLLARAFFTDQEKELQNGLVLTVPYGDVESRQTSAGGSLRYFNVFSSAVALDVVAGHTRSLTRFFDPDRCRYDWTGQCIRQITDGDPTDYLTTERTFFARANLEWLLPAENSLRLSLAPTSTLVEGNERAGPDPNDGDDRRLTTVVAGVEHRIALFDDRLENIVFAKAYAQAVRANKYVGDIAVSRDRDRLLPGFGDSLRYRIAPWLLVKASYEWATRLPNLDEVFGDGLLTLANLELEPERSHNANLGVALGFEHDSGTWRAELNGFLRDFRELILLVRSQDLSIHQNVFGARSLGVEAGASWASPRELLTLSANATELEFRNTESQGTFGAFKGDRIPNRPYLTMNASARVLLRDVVVPRDELSVTWSTRYVHEFFRSWESIGQRDLKEVVPAQTLHHLALVYEVRGDALVLSNSAEIQNVTDADAYDYFGVQRPGRAYFHKISLRF